MEDTLIDDVPTKIITQIYNEDKSLIKKLKFKILSPEEVIYSSVCKIYKDNLFESKGIPIPNGLFDQRMGVLENEQGPCWTCGEKIINCMGHFGHIEFVKPIYNNIYMNQIVNILKCICLKCSRLRIDKNSMKFKKLKKIKNPKRRFKELLELSKESKVCYYRNTENPEKSEGCYYTLPASIKLVEHSKIIIEYDEKSEKVKNISAEKVLFIFKKIDVKDLKYLGC